MIWGFLKQKTGLSDITGNAGDPPVQVLRSWRAICLRLPKSQLLMTQKHDGRWCLCICSHCVILTAEQLRYHIIIVVVVAICCSGDKTTVGGIDGVSAKQHSQSYCSCLHVRHVTAARQLQTRLPYFHYSEHPPISLLRQLRHQLSAVQRVWEDVSQRDDALRPTLRSTADDRLLRRSTLVSGWRSRHGQEPCNAYDKSTNEKVSLSPTRQRVSQTRYFWVWHPWLHYRIAR